MTYHVRTALLSLNPTRPVLVFTDAAGAREFHSLYSSSGDLHATHADWVVLHKPEGLKRVYTAANGDVGFVFEKAWQATAFVGATENVGRMYADDKSERRTRTVYVGDRLV